MKVILALLLCSLITFVSSTKVTKSKKKGLVIPYWPQHFVGDFEAFDTVSWWYNYHTYKNVYQEVPYWCHYPNGTVPGDKSGCFPSDPEVKFVPQVFGVLGYGDRPELEDDPPLPDWEWIFLAYNEPNRPDQANIAPKDCALEYRALMDLYPDKVIVSPATGNADTEWMDEFMAECDKLNCRIDYLATHLYKGTVDERMTILKEYSQRYGGRQIWYTEFAVALERDESKIVEFVEEMLPRLEFAGFIFRYSWFYTRYYEDHESEDNPWFWLDSYNSLLQLNSSELTPVGQAYNQPWHEEQFRPKIQD